MNSPAAMFLYGATTLAALVIAVHFLRFWRETRDGLFLIFAAAFAVLAVNWVLIAFAIGSEFRAGAFLLRLLAFAFIIAGIVRKNLRRAG
jgi:hypothetical protein